MWGELANRCLNVVACGDLGCADHSIALALGLGFGLGLALGLALWRPGRRGSMNAWASRRSRSSRRGVEAARARVRPLGATLQDLTSAAALL